MVRASREQVLAHRIAAQGLHRTGRALHRLAVLDIGVQDASPELARLAFDARLATTPDESVFGPNTDLVLAWAQRGAPFVHRRADVDALAAALYPMSEADARARLNESGPAVQRAGIEALEQFELAASAMRSVVTQPMPKGEASTAVTTQLPPALRRECRSCATRHVSDSAMRSSFLAAGLELEPDTSPPVLRRRPKATLPKQVDRVALKRLVLAYLTVLGPATDADVADYWGVRRTDLGDAWPGDELVEVAIGKRTAYLPEKQQKSFAAPKDPDPVRLLSGIDPYLQARDRDLLVPDKDRHKRLWPVLGRPGVLLAGGELVAVWRAKASSGKLTVTVEPFARLPKATTTELDGEAERVAAVRGLTLNTVTVT